MSLGIKTLWMARPSSRGILRTPVIPREGVSRSQCLYRIRWASLHSAGQIPPPHESTGAAGGGAKSSDEAASPEPSSEEKPMSERSPGKVLIDSLSNEPLLPRSANDSVLVKPFRRYPGSVETFRSKLKHKISLKQQARLETKRQVLGRRLPDWRVILANLTSKSHEAAEPPHDDTMKILVPDEAVRGLRDGGGNEIKTIVERAGCTWTLNEAKNNPGHSWLTLSGAEDTVAKTAKRVMRITKGGVNVRDDGGVISGDSSLSSAEAIKDEEGLSDDKDVSPGASPASLASPPTDAGQSPSSSSSTPTTTTTSSSSQQQQQQQPKQKQKNIFRKYTLEQNAQALEKPAQWTRESFRAYVAALINSKPPRHLHAHLYKPEMSHQESVIGLLHQVFNEEGAQAAIATPAFNMALDYITKRGGSGLGPETRALLTRMEMIRLPMGIDTFHILLRTAAEDKDLHGFAAALRMMDRHKVAPDLFTWLFFLRMFEDEAVRRRILAAMEAKGLLRDELVLRRVAREMVSFDTERWVAAATAAQQGADALAAAKAKVRAARAAARQLHDHNHDHDHDGNDTGGAKAVTAAAMEETGGDSSSLDSFWASQEARYGSKWFSSTAGNKMIEVLGRHGRFGACAEVVERMLADSYAKPDVVTFNTMLTHCKVQRTLDRSIAVVRQMEKAWWVKPDEITYHILSQSAWDMAAIHVLGVVFRYASLAGITSWRMRRRITKVLEGSVDTERAPARFVVPELVADPEAMASICGRPAPEGKKLSHTFAGSAASRWYATRYQDYELSIPLGVAMQRAYERDRRIFAARRFGRPLPQEEPLEIPVRPKKPTAAAAAAATAA